ncbi:hypothetical protein [Pseudoxanthomonas sp. PXM04]|uniref:hypothetical protein n=1 Tax=Pseudoxanthomonas sp. PXM04 TaxID=2769297 RepID=UPI00177CB1CE|nr:hypothetical protein [Pseudoxanthomonas sp. PXM04]MBD9376182.1 hypothetical protein [Pseudoxanthomonas sp. PXM04]
MQPEGIKESLKAWGAATVNRYCYSRTDRSVHVLDQARDMAPGTAEKALQALAGRDGTDRRRLMARATGIKGLHVVPQWAAEPVRATNDAGRPCDLPEIAFDQGIPDHLLWLDRAISQLARQSPLRELIVRTEYTVQASQAVKARMVQEKYGGQLSKWMYRRELERAMEWLDGRALAA